MTLLFLKRLVALCFIMGALTWGSFAQPTVGLDNWFNHETNAKTSKIFHYTWDDQAMSGFSQLGDLFVKRRGDFENLKAANNLVDLLLEKVNDRATGGMTD